CKEDEENEIATFCVQGQWKGLPVEEVILPTMTFVSFRGARIGLPLEKARPIVRQRFGQEFPGGAAYEEGREPKLLADPEDVQRSWLLCSTPELGHDVDSEGSISYSGMNLPYDHDGCSYRYSPVDFCDARHRGAIEDALQHQKPNFNKHYLLVQVDDRPEYFQRTLVLVDTRTGRATPLPFDAFTGPAGKGGEATGYGTLETGVDQPQFCLDGALLVYRVFEQGRFCFGFDGERFTGHETQYMQATDSR
ncbi:TPA: hypothetical protein ACOEN8_002442, partial [Stenotrophomonas maltophilia]